MTYSRSPSGGSTTRNAQNCPEVAPKLTVSGPLDAPLHSSVIRWFRTQKGSNGSGAASGTGVGVGRGVGVIWAGTAMVGRGVALAANGLGTDGNEPHALATTIAGTATIMARTRARVSRERSQAT